METRRATADDVPAIRGVAREAWRAAYDFLPEAEHDAAFEEWYARDRLEAAIVDGEREFAVALAESDGDGATTQVVGFAHAEPVDPAKHDERVGGAELTAVYVHPDHWRAGVGTALVEEVESALRERGFSQLEVAVFAENDRAKAFFDSRGFEQISEQVADLFSGGTERQFVYYHDFV